MKIFAIIFAGLAIIMVLCAATLISVTSIELTFNELVAEKLSNKPEEYFVVTDAEPVLLQAISHLGEPVSLHLLDETEIDDLINQYGTSNLEYQNNYYWVGILFVEPLEIYSQISWMSLFGLVVSTALLVSLAILKGLRQRKRKKQQPQAVN